MSEAVQAVRNTLWQHGFRPMAVYSANHADRVRAGKAPLGNNWQQRARLDPPECISLAAVVAWALNTGILCDGLRAIDFDIDDAALVRALVRLARDMLGSTIIRTRMNSPRCLMVYRAAEGQPTKVAITGDGHGEGHACKIEVLGKGQQFVAYGDHPSGAALLWLHGGPADLDVSTCPAITEAELHRFLNAAAPLIGAEPIAVKQARRPRANGVNGQDHAPPTGEMVDIAAALALVPNDGPPDWEAWNNVGLAIYAATEGSDAGRDLWADWSAKNPADDPDATLARWEHYATSPPDRTGAGKLFAMAADASPGWRKPSTIGARARPNGTEAPIDVVETPPIEPPEPPDPPDDDGPTGRPVPPQLPVITCRAGELPRMIREAYAALLAANVPIYQRGALVQPTEQEYPAADGSVTHSAMLAPVTAPALMKLMAEVAVWQKWDGRMRGGGGYVECDPPEKLVQILLHDRTGWPFPVVRGVLTCPTLRPNGSVLATTGYDPLSRYFLMFPEGLEIPDIPEAPTISDAVEALFRLDALLDSYPFVDDGGVSRSVALAILMTQVLRCGMAVSPLLAVSATAPGTGKSHLVDLASTIAIGRPCPIMGAGKNDEETEKGINTNLLAGLAGFSIDNVHRMVDLAVLNIATERPMIGIRLFGTLERVEVENAVTIYMTGNNLPVVDEQVRRTLLCRMDTQEEQPEQRAFAVDPIRTVLANRGRYIADVLIIARAYLADLADGGSPPNGMKPFGSYPGWSRIVREPLMWLTRPDPVASQAASRANDPETNRLRAVVSAWHHAFGAGALTLASATVYATSPPVLRTRRYDEDDDEWEGVVATHEAHKVAQEQLLEVLRDAFPGRGGRGSEVDTGKWGFWMRKFAGRVVDRMRFVEGGKIHNTVAWKVATV